MVLHFIAKTRRRKFKTTFQDLRMYYIVCACILIMAAKADTAGEGRGPNNRGRLRTTTLRDEIGTPDPGVAKDVHQLLQETDYTDDQIHFMPQTIENPDCHVTTYVIQEQRHGGRCSRMAGGLPFCAVKNYVYPNHPDCLPEGAVAETSDTEAWSSQQWGPYFAHTSNGDAPTASSDGSERATVNPRFRFQRQNRGKR